MGSKITSVNIKDPTSMHIYAEISEKGDLLISGQDIGGGSRAAFGDSDYEYMLQINTAYKNQVLLALPE
jgi:hypothetical protein